MKRLLLILGTAVLLSGCAVDYMYVRVSTPPVYRYVCPPLRPVPVRRHRTVWVQDACYYATWYGPGSQVGQEGIYGR
jgi:hypothetical protein